MLFEMFISSILVLFLFVFGFIFINNMFCFIYLYIDHSLASMQNRSEYPTISNGRYIVNFWLELWYILGKFYLWPLKFINLTINKKQSDLAILLIHGYCR